ncbi:MAG: ankyrin repeat domain-containing protein, partial [Jaaginema sp. PMC 1079.18]|nr:ankyrin repeat domain-containing protein [Jaaginema sp. PMC 1079.18]
MNKLYLEIKKRSIEKIQQLIIKDLDLAEHKFETGETPLCLAVKLNYVEIVEYLLDLGVNPDVGGDLSPLQVAIENNNIEIIRFLLKARANANLLFDGEFPLTLAAWVGNLEVIKLLVDAGADVNLYDANIGTPLCFAARQGHRDVYNYIANLLSGESQKKSEANAISEAVSCFAFKKHIMPTR